MNQRLSFNDKAWINDTPNDAGLFVTGHPEALHRLVTIPFIDHDSWYHTSVKSVMKDRVGTRSVAGMTALQRANLSNWPKVMRDGGMKAPQRRSRMLAMLRDTLAERDTSLTNALDLMSAFCTQVMDPLMAYSVAAQRAGKFRPWHYRRIPVKQVQYRENMLLLFRPIRSYSERLTLAGERVMQAHSPEQWTEARAHLTQTVKQYLRWLLTVPGAYEDQATSVGLPNACLLDVGVSSDFTIFTEDFLVGYARRRAA